MPKNIKQIRLWNAETDGNNKNYNGIRLVRIDFNYPCTYTTLHIEDLKQILKLWIIGEEEKYPREKGFKGRWLLYEEIKKVFMEE